MSYSRPQKVPSAMVLKDNQTLGNQTYGMVSRACWRPPLLTSASQCHLIRQQAPGAASAAGPAPQSLCG